MDMKQPICHGLRSPCYCPWSWSSLPSPGHWAGRTAGLPLEWDQFKLSSVIGKVCGSFLLVLGLHSQTWLQCLQGEHGHRLSPGLFPEPKQVRYNQSKPWMFLVFLHILHHPICQGTDIPFAISEGGPWGLKQPNIDFEAWDVPALPSPKEKGLGAVENCGKGCSHTCIPGGRQESGRGWKQQVVGMGSWFCSVWYHDPRKSKLVV